MLEHWISYLCIDVGDLFVYRNDSMPLIIIIIVETTLNWTKHITECFNLLKWPFNYISVLVLSNEKKPSKLRCIELINIHCFDSVFQIRTFFDWIPPKTGWTRKTAMSVVMHDSCAFFWNCVRRTQTLLICTLFPKLEKRRKKKSWMGFVFQLACLCALVACFSYSLAAWFD